MRKTKILSLFIYALLCTNILFAQSQKDLNSVVANSKKATKAEEENLWKTYSFENDFDDYTQFTFLLRGSNDGYITIGLRKEKAKIYSKAVVLVPSINGNTSFDLKTDDGNKTSIPTPTAMNWSYLSNKTIKGDYKPNTSTRWLFDICLNNQIIALRSTYNQQIEKFQTAGLEEKIFEAGLTIQDFYDAFSNDEF